MKSLSTLLFAVLVPAAAMATDGLQLQPGKWETTTTMRNPFLPAAQSRTEIACLEVAEFDPRLQLQKGMDEMKCESLDYQATAEQLSWRVRCVNPMDPSAPVVGEGVWHANGDSGSGSVVMQMSLPGLGLQEFRIESTSRRLGACD